MPVDVTVVSISQARLEHWNLNSKAMKDVDHNFMGLATRLGVSPEMSRVDQTGYNN